MKRNRVSPNNETKFTKVMALADYRKVLGICWVTSERLMFSPQTPQTKKNKKPKMRMKMCDKFWLKRQDSSFEIKCTDKDGGGTMLLTKSNAIGDVNTLKNYDISSIEYKPSTGSDRKMMLARFFYLILHSYVKSKKFSKKRMKELKYF